MDPYSDLLRQRRDASGKEIFEIKPVILGGSPTDTENKVVLTREQHIEVVRYWNRIIADLRAKKGGEDKGGRRISPL